MCTIYHGLFCLPLGVIDMLCSVILAICSLCFILFYLHESLLAGDNRVFIADEQILQKLYS